MDRIGGGKESQRLPAREFRPVSLDTPITVIGHLDTKNAWAARKGIVLRNVYTDFEKILDDSRKTNMSLGVLNSNISGFEIKKVEREWDAKKLQAVRANQNQLDFFEQKEVFEIVRKLPYEFSYRFTADDGKSHTLMI